MADEKPNHNERREEHNSAWERFRVFVSKAADVPKEEADEERRKWEQARGKQQTG